MNAKDRKEIMWKWDTWRQYIADGGKASWPRDAFEALLDEFEGAYHIGDTLKDENGNMGQVVIQWDDGDRCHFVNDTNHQNPVVIGNINKNTEG